MSCRSPHLICWSLIAILLNALPARADTAFYYHSQPGDFAGQGFTRTVRPSDGFTVHVESYTNYLLLIFNASVPSGPGGPSPMVRLLPPPTTSGSAESTTTSGDATTGQKGFAFTNNSNTLCESTGRYEVLEVSYNGAGELLSLALNFRQTCIGSIASSFGQLRYNSSIPIDSAVRAPDPFVFAPVIDALLSTEYITPARVIAGLTEPVPVAITNGEYSIDGGSFTALPGLIQAGQTIRVRLTSAVIANSLRTATLDVGEYRTDFRVGTSAGVAPQPNGEPLVAIVSQLDNVTSIYSPALNKVVSTRAGAWGQASVTASLRPPAYQDSWTMTVTGINNAALTAGTYVGVPKTSTTTQPALHIDVSPYSHCIASANMTVHEVEYLPDGSFGKLAVDFVQGCAVYANRVFGWIRINSVVPIDYSIRRPVVFAFPSIAGVAPGAAVISQEIPIQGINVPVAVSISGGEYSIAGAPFTSMPGTLNPGQRLRLRITASAQANKVATATVSVGEGGATFSVGTAPSATEQPDGGPLVVLREHHFNNQSMSVSVLSPATFYNIAPVPNTPGLNIQARAATALYDYYTWRLVARGANNTLPGPGIYKNIMTTAPPAEPTISTYAFPRDGFACGSLPTTTNYTIHEVAYSPEQVVTTLALDFVERCSDSNSTSTNDAYAVFGNVRFNSTMPIDYSIRLPRRFQFNSVGNILPRALATSNEITVEGINVSVPVSISGTAAEASIDGTPFSSAPGMVSAGQKVRVRAPAPTQSNSVLSYVVNIGEGSAVFNVGSRPTSTQQSDGSALVVLISQGNEPIGQGRNYAFSPATFSSIYLGTNFDNGVAVNLNGPDGQLWSFNFTAANKMTLVPGIYSNAARWPFQEIGRNGISVTGNSSGCAEVSGSFVVHEIEYAASATSRLALDFVHVCQGRSPLYGYLRYNSTIPISYPVDSIPTPFVFGDRNGIARGAVVASNTVTPVGFGVTAPISVSGGAYSIDGGPFLTDAGTISPGQTVTLQVTAPLVFGGSAITSLTIGGVVGTFTVRTDAVDLNPDPFTLGTINGAARSQWIYSPIVTPTGFNSPTFVSIQGGEFSIAGGSFGTSSAMIAPGQTLQVRLMSSSAYADYRVATLTVGGQTTFVVQTEVRHALNITVTGPGSVSAAPALFACSSSCTEYVPADTVISLTPAAAPGVAFVGWSGACTGTGNCMLTMNTMRTVSAAFGPLPPGAPVINQIVPGNSLVTINFAAPTQTGGPAIGYYTATCNPGNVSATTTASSVTVTGLANDIPHTCSVIATNIAGPGQPSAIASATPSATAPYALIGIQSRKTHGAAGIFDLQIGSAAASSGLTIEPRVAGAGHRIVFQFNAKVVATGGVDAIDDLGLPISIANVSLSGHEVLITLGSVADHRRVNLTVSGVNGTLTATAAIGFMLGDVNQSRSVEAADVNAVKSRSGQTVDSTNFFYDITTNGVITASDVAVAKARLGNTMP